MIKPNLIDRAVAVFDPQKARDRVVARYQYGALTGSYKGASYSRRALKDWRAPVGDADNDSLFDLQTLRNRSSDLVRNSPVASGALNTTVTSVIGAGLRQQSVVDYEAAGISQEQGKSFERQAEKLFKVWSNSVECDATRTQNFNQMTDLVFRSTLERGDCFVLLPMFSRKGSPFGLKLQVVEADRVSNPQYGMNTKSLAAGVERDANGAPIAYHIADVHPGAATRDSQPTWKRVRAFGKTTGRHNVIHIYRKLRPGQARGIPMLANVIEPLKQLEKYTNAELMAAVVSGMFTVFVESQNPDNPLATFASNSAVPQPADPVDDYKLGNGAIVGLAAGETVKTTNPGRPNAQFDPFVQAIIQQIGLSLEIPYEVLLKHFSSSYSASQAALLEAWRFFNARREWIADVFCRPVYESFIGEQVAAGRLVAPGFFSDPMVRAAYSGSKWIGRPMGHIREDITIKAAQMRIDSRLSTRAKEAAMISGDDWETLNEQLTHEEDLIPSVPQGNTP